MLRRLMRATTRRRFSLRAAAAILLKNVSICAQDVHCRNAYSTRANAPSNSAGRSACWAAVVVRHAFAVAVGRGFRGVVEEHAVPVAAVGHFAVTE